MARTQPHSWLAPDLADPCPIDPYLQRTSEPQEPVLFWDPQPSRRQLVSRYIAQCGVRPHCIEDESAVPPIKGSRDSTLAVVALGGCPSSSDPSFEGILRLKRHGFRVICYEDGTQSWPLSVRCRLLLAGSSWLLDSTDAEFAAELCRLLTQLLQAEVGKRDEETRVKGVMQQLGSVGESPAIMAVFQTICRISPLSDLPILITGETGTGKELLAHAVHQLDLKRRHGPFVALNCGAISPSLAESELFGHRRGAFTGADRDRKGLIRSAEGGVLFLDEIGELDDAIQAKLLRVLQENRVLGVGEEREVAISVRIIAATNRDLESMVQRGTFRTDLFHRLHVLAVHIPPLRERPADLNPLIEHFLTKYRFLRPTGALSVHPDFIAAVAQLELPGNARELENLVRWALVNKDNDTPLNLHDLPLAIWQELSEQGRGPSVPSGSAEAVCYGHGSPGETGRPDVPVSIMSLLDLNDWNLSRSLQYCEKLLLEAALQRAQGNQSRAARLLGITPRSVYNKLHKHHLHR